jgi:hypothetical protein
MTTTTRSTELLNTEMFMSSFQLVFEDSFLLSQDCTGIIFSVLAE